MKLEAKHKRIAIGLGLGIFGSAVVGGTVGLMSSNHDISDAGSNHSPQPDIAIEGIADLDGAIVAESTRFLPDLSSAADPAIVSSTDAPQRINTISAGRQDPFASPFVSTAPRAVRAQASTANTASSNSPSATPFNPATGQSISLIPLPAPPALPSLPSLPPSTFPTQSAVAAAPTSTAPATIHVPQAPVLPQGSLVDAIQITGVVQLGDRISAIVQVPNEGSRYAQVGERIASGQVLVKHINMANSQEPLVILEYNGREYSKIVGGTTLIGLL